SRLNSSVKPCRDVRGFSDFRCDGFLLIQRLRAGHPVYGVRLSVKSSAPHFVNVGYMQEDVFLVYHWSFSVRRASLCIAFQLETNPWFLLESGPLYLARSC